MIAFNFDIDLEKMLDEIDQTIEKHKAEKRKDFCYKCNTDKAEWHCMVLKCKICGNFLIGHE